MYITTHTDAAAVVERAAGLFVVVGAGSGVGSSAGFRADAAGACELGVGFASAAPACCLEDFAWAAAGLGVPATSADCASMVPLKKAGSPLHKHSSDVRESCWAESVASRRRWRRQLDCNRSIVSPKTEKQGTNGSC